MLLSESFSSPLKVTVNRGLIGKWPTSYTVHYKQWVLHNSGAAMRRERWGRANPQRQSVSLERPEKKILPLGLR